MTIANVGFQGNTAIGVAGVSGLGGAIADLGTLTLSDCPTISGNSAGHLGGFLCIIQGDTTIKNCALSANSAALGGESSTERGNRSRSIQAASLGIRLSRPRAMTRTEVRFSTMSMAWS